MTTIPGAHTHVIQQSNRAHDALHNLKPVQQDPEQLQNQQIIRENIEQTTVISADQSGEVNVESRAKKREEDAKRLSRKKRVEKRKKGTHDPDQPGNLLNTVA